jgi:N-acetylmuramoyl-L-alanine amidase
MRNYSKLLFFLGLLALPGFCHAQEINISSLRYSTTSDQSRIQLEVSASPKHRVFVLNNPSRLVIDIKNARLAKERLLVQPSLTNPLFARVEIAEKSKNNLRLVFSLKQSINAKDFSLTSNNKNKHLFQVALINKTEKNAVKNNVVTQKSEPNKLAVKDQIPIDKMLRNVASPKIANSKSVTRTLYALKTDKPRKKFVIAVDAGHGGDDPGAHGPSGIEEKKVVFAIAKKLGNLINEHPEMRAVMIRKGDYYIDLRKRMRIARKAGADLFISIHADAFPDASVKGASVYILSRSGASSEAARWLAKTENAADLMGGVSLDDKEDVLASVLLDLSQSATQQGSMSLAKSVLRNFGRVGQLHKNSVQSAGFIVLKSPDIPSILVETAYISNPSEESNLTDNEQQNKIATAIFNGVRGYIRQTKPAVDVRMASL